MKIKIPQLHNGFTLMEVMVSVSIFAIIITIGIGSLLTINSTLQKTRAERQAIDGLSFLMDTMTRQIRTGVDWSDDRNSFSFKPQVGEEGVGPGSGDRITYYFEPSEGKIFYQEGDDSPRDITPAGVTIDTFQFLIQDDALQPYVSIEISAGVTSGRQESKINLQTGVSQRAIIYDDVPENNEDSLEGEEGSPGLGPVPIDLPSIETP